MINEILKPKSRISKSIESKSHSLQFLPESMVSISNQKKIQFRGKNLKSSCLIDIIHSLILKYYFRKENKFNLSSTILREKYGETYNYYMEFLVQRDLIKIIKNHQKGKNARVYKLNDDIINGKILRYENNDKVLLKKYKKTLEAIDYIDLLNNSIELSVRKKIVDDLFYVEVDIDRAILFLDTSKQEISIYNRNKYSVECIKDKHIFYHFDSFGRFHTNFTILKSFIRKNCLLIEGEETLEIDISNSQPLFLTKIAMQFDEMIVISQEFQLFESLTLSGNLYQYILDNSYLHDKKIVKEFVYKVLFGRNFNSNADRMFSELFPEMHLFIKKYKKEKGDYRILSYELQRLESDLIFNKVIKDIMYLYPDIRLITVHDSIVYPKKYKFEVEGIFNSILKSEFNI